MLLSTSYELTSTSLRCDEFEGRIGGDNDETMSSNHQEGRRDVCNFCNVVVIMILCSLLTNITYSAQVRIPLFKNEAAGCEVGGRPIER